jgi:enoyl-CoA hydratase/carnithine racemase
MPAEDLVLTEQQGVVRCIALNRPSALNALTRALAAALVDALREADRDSDVGAIVLTGVGERAFCAGVDLAEAVALTPGDIPAWFTGISQCYRQILEVDKPVIIALNGVAAGGGYQMGLVADWRIGHPGTRMSQPEINAGLPSIMGSYLMRFHLPHGINQALSYTGQALDATQCQHLGLLNELVPQPQLAAAALSRARDLADRSPQAFRATKSRFREQILAGFDAARAAAIAGMQAAYAAGEAQRHMQAFLDRRRS